jgi:hypothetical protein
VLQSLDPNGTWMIVEPFAHDKLEDNLNPIGRIFYGRKIFADYFLGAGKPTFRLRAGFNQSAGPVSPISLCSKHLLLWLRNLMQMGRSVPVDIRSGTICPTASQAQNRSLCNQ